MGKRPPVNEMNHAQLLGDARTNATKNDKAITELLFRLTNKREWSHRQCLDVYESILRQYLDDGDSLQLLLALSGLMDGYKSIKTAEERREKYLNYLDEIDSASKYRGKEPGTLRKDEDDLLKYVAKRLEDDLESGTLPQLIEKWTSPQSESAEKSGTAPPVDEPDAIPPQPPKQAKTRKSWNIKHSVVFQIRDININIQPKQLLLSTIVLLLLVLAGVFAYDYFHRPTENAPVSNEPLAPGEIRQIVIVVPSEESVNGLLKYISSDPDIIDVSSSGFLMACQNQPGESSRSAEIQVLDETGIIATESYIVDFTKDSYDPPVDDINDFEPDFSVNQKIRIVGDTEWHNYVDTKVGDELEIQFEYRNTSEYEHINVAVKDVLPANLGYIPGSTTIFTAKYPDGVSIDQDDLVKNGISIGTYGSGSNAYIRFRVRVVDINLVDGVTGLVNWSQASVNGVTLQDFATVRVTQ